MESISPSDREVISFRDWLRPFLGILAGIIAGLLVSASMDTGANLFFEQSDENFYFSDLILWGDHWFLRAIASLSCTLWGGFIGGLTARRRGSLVGLFSSIPTSLVWLSYLIVSFSGYFEFGDNYFEVYTTIPLQIMSILIIIGSFIIGYIGGEAGEGFSSEFSNYFDQRKHSLFAIKWYHYLWIPIPLHLIVMQSGWVILYSTDFLYWYWADPFSILPSIFLIPLYGSLYITVNGLSKSYMILSGIDKIPNLKERFLGVLKFGCGMPILAVLIQTVVTLIGYGISKILE